MVAITYGKLGWPQICCNLPDYFILFVRLYYFDVLLILFIFITSNVIAFKKAVLSRGNRACHAAINFDAEPNGRTIREFFLQHFTRFYGAF